MDFGVKSVQETDHAHVQGVVVHGSVAIFRHDVVNPDVTGIDAGQFETKKRLREDNFLGKTSQHLAQKTDLYPASGRRARLSAVLNLVAFFVSRIELGTRMSNVFVQSTLENLPTQRGEI